MKVYVVFEFDQKELKIKVEGVYKYEELARSRVSKLSEYRTFKDFELIEYSNSNYSSKDFIK